MNIKTITLLPCFLMLISCFAMADKPMSQQEKESYSLGVMLGKQIKQNFNLQGIEYDQSWLLQGIKDSSKQQPLLLSGLEIQAVIQELQLRIAQRHHEKVKTLALTHFDQLFSLKDTPTFGDASASIKIVVFFDYQ